MDDHLPTIDYPVMIAEINRVEPVPRRIRAFIAGVPMLDTIRALYVWEWPYYPQFYVPVEDVTSGILVDEGTTQNSRRGTIALHGVQLGAVQRAHCAKVHHESPIPGLSGTVRFDWNAFDAWFEEDEQVFVHPRNPYVRVDALRSTRTVRVELGGVLLAESSAPVMVFETGLPTRYYFNRSEVSMDRLTPSPTVTECPYKGSTTGYWSVDIDGTMHSDVAWAYDFPTRQLLPIGGLIGFYNEHVDISVDGHRLDRPVTKFS